jgi:hypothetical protein
MCAVEKLAPNAINERIRKLRAELVIAAAD